MTLIFSFKIQHDNPLSLNISIESLDKVSLESNVVKKWYFPEVKGSTLWIINDFEKLSGQKQYDVSEILNNKLKENSNLKIILPFNEPTLISTEVLQNSTLLLDSSFLPPIGQNILDSIKVTDLREKFILNKIEKKLNNKT